MISKADRQLLGRLLTYEKHSVLITFFSLSLIGFALAALGRMGIANTAVMIERGWHNPETLWVVLVPLYFPLVIVIQGIGHVFGSYFLSRVARQVIMKVRAQLLKSLLRKEQAVYDTQPSDSLSSILIYHVEQIYSCIAGGIITVVKESLTVAFLLGYLLYLNSWFTVLMLLILPVAIVLIRFISKRFYILSKRIQSSIEDFSKDSTEMLRAIQLIRLYSSVHFQSRRFEDSNANNYRQNMKLVLTQLLSSPVLEMLVAMLLALMVWLVLAEQLPDQFASLGSFTSYILTVGLIGQPIKKLSLVTGVIQKGIVAAESVFHYLDLPKEDIERGKNIGSVHGKVSFHKVSMQYANGTQALDDVSFSVNPGEVVALVGRSGSGKSTLANLLLRFYAPTHGAVFLDGEDISTVSLRSLRENLSQVSQNQIFFNDTIASNIAYAEETVDDKRLQRAADMAHVTEFVEQLPEGFETSVGENGSRLSGGQRQRIAIARALYRDAPVLILDEATSALDNESDDLIQSALKNLIASKTTIVIAHKLSNIVHADTIVVLDRGKVVQQGTHQQLMKVDGLYRSMYQRNSGEADQ